MAGGSMSAAKGRDKTLDSCRAIFILVVLFYHYLIRWAPPEHEESLYHYDHVYSPLWELGRFGVHAFFVISGLFITSTLLRSGSALEFGYRRFYRIFPAFFLAATLTFFFTSLAAPEFRVGLKDYLLTLTFVPGNLGAEPVDGAYWSLAVEAKFYFWTAICYAALRERFWIGLLALGAAGTGTGLVSETLAKEILLAPFMSLFLAGIALALWAFEGQRRAAVITGAGAALLYLLHWDFMRIAGEPSLAVNMVVLSSIGVIAALVLTRASIAIEPLPYLGLISYEIYLLHQYLGVTIIGWAKAALGLPDWAAFLLAGVIVVALASLFFHILERPLQKAIRRLWDRGLFIAGSGGQPGWRRMADPEQ
jgi:peptidoglycan/LPS O-acetylase OafA/YrhL